MAGENRASPKKRCTWKNHSLRSLFSGERARLARKHKIIYLPIRMVAVRNKEMKEHIVKYDELRAIGKNLNSKLFKELNGSEIKIAARALGVLKNNALLLDSDEDMDRYTDFAINDYYDVNGNNTIKRYLKKHNDINGLEKSILNSLLLSKASLYQIVKSDRESATIQLRDLLNQSEDINIIDRGFSSSPMIVNFLVYTRVLSFDEINMTSGAPMIYGMDSKESLLSKYKKKMDKVNIGNEQTKLSVAFYQLHEKYGYHQVEYA